MIRVSDEGWDILPPRKDRGISPMIPLQFGSPTRSYTRTIPIHMWLWKRTILDRTHDKELYATKYDEEMESLFSLEWILHLVIQFQESSNEIISIKAAVGRFRKLYVFMEALINEWTSNNNKEENMHLEGRRGLHGRDWRAEGEQRWYKILIKIKDMYP